MPEGLQRLILVRHCAASGQWPGAPLTPEGLRQAERLNDFLADQPVDFVVSSEYQRARQSAEPLALSNGLHMQVDARLNERTLSATPVANWREILRDSFSDPELRGPGGESAGEVIARAWSAIREVWKNGPQMPVAVTHGNLMSLVLHSIDNKFGYESWESLSNPDVYLLENTRDSGLEFIRMWR